MKAISRIFCIDHIFRLNLQSNRNLTTEYIARVKEPKRRIQISKDVEKYMSSKEHLLKIKGTVPARFLKKTRKAPDDLYLVDSFIAKDVVKAINPYILNQNKTVIETNPGFGFITKELLDSGLPEAQLYESTVCFRNHILELDKQYPGKLKIYNRDFFSIWQLSYQDRHDNGDRVKRLLSNVKMKQWTEGPAMTIVGTTASSNFIRHLLLSLVFRFGVMTYGRCELFLIMPPYLYLQLTADPNVGYLFYRASSVLFQIFCDHKILLKLPRTAFLPWDNVVAVKTNSKLRKFYRVDPEYMYLTRIEFKKNLPVSMDKVQQLWYFVQHMMISRKTRIIPSMEKWIPGCGIKLILANNKPNEKDIKLPEMNIYTQSGNLTYVDFINLFNEFSSWPEYAESSFIASMESALLKMESLQDLDIHSQVSEEHAVQKAKEIKNIENET